MVTDGHQRPEIPQEQLCPSASFPGMGEYVKLMQSCWEQVSSPARGSLSLTETYPCSLICGILHSDRLVHLGCSHDRCSRCT